MSDKDTIRALYVVIYRFLRSSMLNTFVIIKDAFNFGELRRILHPEYYLKSYIQVSISIEYLA